MRRRALACVLLVLSACADKGDPKPQNPPPPIAASGSETASPACTLGDSHAALGSLRDRPASELVAKGTGVDPYKLESGVWLEQAPVLVNEDFDFATAMAMGGVGAGIAAAKRKTNNEQNASQRADLVLPTEVVARLDELRACGIHRWGLLWNGASPVLLIITDRFDAQGKLAESKTNEYGPVAIGALEPWLAE